VDFTLNPCKHQQGRRMTMGSLPFLQAAARWLAGVARQLLRQHGGAAPDRARCAVGACTSCLNGFLKKQSYQRLLHAR
jgi:hypothetical protein